jgi:protein-S-isoprenylcysteine O-methyltransferase Ste14
MPPSVIVFLIGALGLAVAWRRHLAAPGSHGFYRLFAFTAILGLVAWNAPAWFVEPLSLIQWISWSFLAGTLAIAWVAGRKLRRLGRPVRGIEPTTALVTSGIYGLVRHPLYASLLLLVAGTWLKDVSWASSGLALMAAAGILATARAEERELEAQFGEAYREYRARTKRFLPGVW